MKGFSCLRRRKAQGGRALVVQVLCVALNWLQNSLGKKANLELSPCGNVFTGFTQLMENCAADKLLASKENVGEGFRNSCLNALPFQWFHSSGCREFLVLLPCFPPPEQKGLDPPALPSQRASSSSKSDEISLFHITIPKTLMDMEYLAPAGWGVTIMDWRCHPALCCHFLCKSHKCKASRAFPTLFLQLQRLWVLSQPPWTSPTVPRFHTNPGKCFPVKTALQKWLSWSFLFTSKSQPGTMLIAMSRIN